MEVEGVGRMNLAKCLLLGTQCRSSALSCGSSGTLTLTHDDSGWRGRGWLCRGMAAEVGGEETLQNRSALSVASYTGAGRAVELGGGSGSEK